MNIHFTLKKFSRRITLGFALLLVLFSCKKERVVSDEVLEGKTEIISKEEKLQAKFAKLFARAIKDDNNLRSFIKNESLKQFDNDYDILYQQVKDVEINNGESFRKKLLNYVSLKELEDIEANLPLLTIFVPTIPNFNPDTWNAVNEIPKVAVNSGRINTPITLYGDSGDSVMLKSNQIPGFPVLVVKQNERVKISNAGSNKLAVNKSLRNVNLGTKNFTFAFIDEAFDGSITSNKEDKIESLKINKFSKLNTSTSRLAPSPNISNPNSIDQINVDAYNSGNEWQRDFVYYGITANQPTGKFKNNYSEFITSFKFLTPDAFWKVSDQSEDPTVNPVYLDPNRWTGGGPFTMWTEGSLEIKITVLINAKNGLGNELSKIISVKPSELVDIQYEEQSWPGTPWQKNGVYYYKSITCKEYHPNIELIPWDLENYGTAWKFIFYEIDNAQEVTNSYENSSTFASNFGYDASFGEQVKIGLKFGTSLTTSEKRTYSVKTTLNSDFLGEATLTFDQPVITGISNGNYNTREITTGNLLSISVEPRKVFD